MPLVDLQPLPFGSAVTRPQTVYEAPGITDDGEESPAGLDVLYSAFRQGNTVASTLSRETYTGADEGLNPWEKLKGTQYEQYFDRFLDVYNTGDFERKKAQIDRELSDKKILESAPWYVSFPSQLLAGTLDLPTLLPGGAFVRGAKGGYSIARSALMTGTAAGVGVGVQELALQGSQETRTLEESGMNIGAGILLGGLLGAAGAKLLTNVEYAKIKALAEGLDAAELNAVVRGARQAEVEAALQRLEPVPDTHVRLYHGGDVETPGERWVTDDPVYAKTVADRSEGRVYYTDLPKDSPILAGRDTESPSFKAPDELTPFFKPLPRETEDALRAAIPDADPSGFGPNAAGAAPAFPVELSDNTIAGKVASAVAGATRRLNPALRTMTSVSPAVRETMSRLAEITLYLKKNLKGVATEASVETLMKEYNAGLVLAIRDTKASFKEYRKSGGTLKRDQFREAVGRAMRRGDTAEDGNDYISRVAKKWRSEVFEPLKQRAMDIGLLPEDVTVEEAASYFSRVWNKKALVAHADEFKRIVTDYYTTHLAEQYEKSVFGLGQRQAKVRQTIEDLTLTPEARETALDDIDNRLALLDQIAGTSVRDASDNLSDLTSAIRAAKKAGNMAEVERLRAEAAQVKQTSGLAEYRSQRAELRARRKNVSYGAAGLDERSSAILDQINDIESRAYRDQEKLIKRGQKLEKELDTLDADAQTVLINDFADSYASLAKRAEASAERTNKAIVKMGEDAGKTGNFAALKGISDRFNVEHSRQVKFAEKMRSIEDNLRLLTNMDHDSVMDGLRMEINKAVQAVSGRTLAKGEQLSRLAARMEKLSPERVSEKIKNLKDGLAETERRFYDRWEVKNLGENVNVPGVRPDFTEAARAIAENVHTTLSGFGEPSPRPEFARVNVRGPMKDRTFHIPDKLIEKFLESDVEEVGRRYVRVMGADVELTRKFGRPDMQDQINAVKNDYGRLLAHAKDDKTRALLGEKAKADIRDIESVRDIIRGVSRKNELETRYDHLARIMNHVNYLRAMGNVALASLPEIIRPAMVHGLLPYLSTVKQFSTNLKAVKLSIDEARKAGNIAEAIMHHRLATFAEIGDPLSHRGPVEAFLENMTNVASKWNGLAVLTDFQKMMASVMTQDRILKGVMNYGKLPAKEKSYLAFLGIDESMARSMAEQFGQHGEILNGVRVAHTDKWVNAMDDATRSRQEVVRRAYRAAINKDVDSIITTRGAADVPLFNHTPTGRIILQFKSFFLAAHQRVLLRGLQEGPTKFISGLIGLSLAGALVTYLKAISSNRLDKLPDFANNPGWWIGEGIDQSGVISVPFQLANTIESMTAFNPIKDPMSAFDNKSAISTKVAVQNPIGALLGPSVGTISDLKSVATIPSQMYKHSKGDVPDAITKGQKNAVERSIPFNTYAGVHQILRYLVNPPEE